MSIEFKKGMQIRVKTKTKDDVFGTVTYEITEVGLPNRGVVCSMLFGTGKAARQCFIVRDTEDKILQDISKGITEIVPESEHAKNKQNSGIHQPSSAARGRAMGIEM